MQPRTVRSEQHLAGASAAHRLLKKVEAAHAGRIGIDIRVPHQVVDQRKLGAPVVGKAAQVRLSTDGREKLIIEALNS